VIGEIALTTITGPIVGDGRALSLPGWWLFDVMDPRFPGSQWYYVTMRTVEVLSLIILWIQYGTGTSTR
jgi:hypothetical protein